MSGGPQGHNVSDVLKPWTHTIADVLDIMKLNYSYKVAANAAHISALTIALKPPSRPATQPGRARSPFWAD